MCPGFWIRRPEDKPWGLRLRLQVTFAVNEFTFLDEITFDSLSVITLVPLAEFWIPIGHITTLRPYVGLGWGKDLKGSDWAWLGEAGVRVDIEPQFGDWELLVRPELELNASRTRTRVNDDSVAGTFLKLDVLRPLWFDIGNHTPDVSIYGQFRYYFDAATFGFLELAPTVIDRQYEVGITLGARPQLKLWKLRLSRLHVAYRWGDGLSGIRIKIGTR